MKRHLRAASAAAAIVALDTAARADIWGDIGRVIAAPVTLPAQTTVEVLRGHDPAGPLRQTVNSTGSVVTTTTELAQRVDQIVHSGPRDAVQRNLGGDWLHAYDTMTGSQRVSAEMGFTAGRFLGGCLQGQPCNLNQMIALPLAASLRDSYKVYINQSQPLSPQTVQLLSRVMPYAAVANARIAYGATPDFTAPGFLNAGYHVFGQGHAVTVANLMIFDRPLDPNSYSDWNWLLHELHHTEQYAAHSANVLESIDGFAVDYIQYANSMEQDAQNMADARQTQLNQICQYGC